MHFLGFIVSNEGASVNPNKVQFLWLIMSGEGALADPDKVHFLEFIMSSDEASTDPKKVKAMRDWPTPTTMQEVKSFHGLTTSYRRFVRGFNTIIPLTTNYLKVSSCGITCYENFQGD